MGHSMGGRVALLFALQHPERLESLMLIASSAAAPEGDIRRRFELLRKLALDEGIAAVLKSGICGRPSPGTTSTAQAPINSKGYSSKTHPPTSSRRQTPSSKRRDMTGRLGEIQAPTWACMGEKDAGPMAYGEMFEERIPNCVRTIMPRLRAFSDAGCARGFFLRVR